MKVLKQLKENRDDILRIAAKHGAYNIRVFGSVVRGEDLPESDVDFLVDLESDRSLFDIGGLLIELKNYLKRDVDVVTKNGLHWYIRDRILEEAQLL
jgi:uncharacterized protein